MAWQVWRRGTYFAGRIEARGTIAPGLRAELQLHPRSHLGEVRSRQTHKSEKRREDKEKKHMGGEARTAQNWYISLSYVRKPNGSREHHLVGAAAGLMVQLGFSEYIVNSHFSLPFFIEFSNNF